MSALDTLPLRETTRFVSKTGPIPWSSWSSSDTTSCGLQQLPRFEKQLPCQRLLTFAGTLTSGCQEQSPQIYRCMIEVYWGPNQAVGPCFLFRAPRSSFRAYSLPVPRSLAHPIAVHVPCSRRPLITSHLLCLLPDSTSHGIAFDICWAAESCCTLQRKRQFNLAVEHANMVSFRPMLF